MGFKSYLQVVVAFAALLTLTEAMPAKDDVDRLLSILQERNSRYDDYGYNARNLDSLGGGNLLREIHPALYARGRFGHRRTLNDVEPSPYYRRPYDPIMDDDLAAYAPPANFAKKSGGGHINFDELDHTNFGFGKRSRQQQLYPEPAPAQ